ncbi:D-glycero-alpha-D-manno-heptose 7-phosphate kinase [subsurface metagenome]
MIIVRSPLRISLGGGGTDLPSYYREHDGFLIAASINKYVYITIHETFMSELIIKYSKLERVARVEEVKHPLIREAIKLVDENNPHIEITSMADIPAGTGLGSSGSFITALLKALHTYKRDIIHPFELASQACQIEIDILKEPVGKQDQYIAAYGGITCFQFLRDDSVKAWPLQISEETKNNLEDDLVLFYTGYTRSASSILKEQDQKSKQSDQRMIENLHFVKKLGLESRQALEQGDLRAFAGLMNEHWEYKKQRASNMTNKRIDEWYRMALENGALGGKLIGAGGGGFLMFYAENKNKLRHVMNQAGLREVRFRFDFEGTKVIVQ